MAKQTESTGSRIISELPTLVGIVGLFVIASLYWVQPGWDVALTIRDATTLSLIFPTAIVVLLLLRRHIYNLSRREESWPYDITTIGSCLFMILLYLIGGMEDPTLAALYSNVSVVGTMAVISAIAVGIFSAMMRIYRAKTPTMAFLIALSILALLTYSPLGEMIYPGIPQLGDFVQTYISGAADSAFWISTYIGAVALITRMILLKERLRPA